jgi:hypothetical protein
MSDNWRLNVSADNSMSFWGSDWHRYSTGYVAAGRVILEHLREHPRERDSLAFPILFLFRHYLELRLKEVAIRAGILLDAEEPIVKRHNLSFLWTTTRPLIEKAYPDDERSILDRAEAAIAKINDLDPDSMRFRYPVTSTGGPSFPGVEYINPADIVDDLQETLELLDGVTEGLLVALDYRGERG